MRVFREELTVVKKIDDFVCDICDNSCQLLSGIGADFLEMKVSWGYGSSYDGEMWEAHVCQGCVDEHLSPLVKFNKEPYKQWIQ